MASTSWNFAPGRHKVTVGTSLKRALKARKGIEVAVPKRTNLPDREFYSVRYPFKPSSIDTTQPGTLEVKRGSDPSANAVIVTHPSTQSGEAHEFTGGETPAKDWHCALVYDEETGSYILEKIESFIALDHPQRRSVSTSTLRSPKPPSTSNSSKNPTPAPLQDDADDDAAFEEILPDSLLTKPRNTDIGEEDIALSKITPVAPPQRPPKKPPATKSRPAEVPSSKPPAKTPQAKPKKSAKRATPTFSDAEDETLEFGRPTKRTRPSPPPAPAPAPAPPAAEKKPQERARLELPGMSTSYARPLPAPVSLPPPPSSSNSRKAISRQHQPPPPEPLSPPLASAPALDSEDDDEDDWEPIATAPEDEAPAHASASAAPGVVDEGRQELVDELEMMMNQDLEEVDADAYVDSYADGDGDGYDFLAAVVGAETPEPPDLVVDSPRPSGPPISMKDLAMLDSNDEDDYSSSDESDDD